MKIYIVIKGLRESISQVLLKMEIIFLQRVALYEDVINCWERNFKILKEVIERLVML